MSNDNNFKRESLSFKQMSDVNKYRSLEALFCCKAAGSSRNTKET